MKSLVPDSFGSEQQNSGAGRRFGRKGWLIIAAVLVVVLIGALSIFIIGNDKKAQQGDVYYDREGFDRAKLSEAIGDPAPLVTKPGGTAVAYKGANVIQACNLLTVEDVRAMKLQLSPNSQPALERNFFDGQSNGAVSGFSTSLASAEDGNNCSYPLEKPKGSIDIDVYQPAYSQPSAIDYEISRFDRRGSAGGFARYERKFEDSTYYLMRDGDAAFQVYLRHVTDKNLAEQLITKIAENYTKQKSSPAGPLQFAYDTPIFKKSYLNGCSITAATDVKQVFGAEAAPLVTERVATATGVISFTLKNDELMFAQIQNECVRRAVPGDNFGDRRSLTTETTSFTEAEGAMRQMASGRQLDDKVTELSGDIGDDAYFSYTTGDKPEITIRKGRFVVNVGIYDQSKPDVDDEQILQMLVPTAQAIAQRIQG